MPKKRHQSAYSKPPSTPPASLESSGLQSNHHQNEKPQSGAVNDILTRMRNVKLYSEVTATPAPPAPSMPPEASMDWDANWSSGWGGSNSSVAGGSQDRGDRGGRGGRGAARRKRPPPGPAPPPSWLAQSRLTPRRHRRPPVSAASLTPQAAERFAKACRGGYSMPGTSRPARGSLVDMSLRAVARDWDVLVRTTGDADELGVAQLPGSLKAALISHLSALWWVERAKGITVADLRLLLMAPPLSSWSSTAAASNAFKDWVDASEANMDFHYLDLAASIGDSITIRDVTDLLFPYRQLKNGKGKGKAVAVAGNDQAAAASAARPQPPPNEPSPPDAWDAPGAALRTVPRSLLPNLTHLSLALAPGQYTPRDSLDTLHFHTGPPPVSWRQLLELAEHLPTLTHLSLAYWPEPTLRLHARHAMVAAPPPALAEADESFNLFWNEATSVVKRLSQSLYGLEYLDITGCSGWAAALNALGPGAVDWVRDWGRVTQVLLRPSAVRRRGSIIGGVFCYPADDTYAMEVQQRLDNADEHPDAAALFLEKGIRDARAGQGRPIQVLCDPEEDWEPHGGDSKTVEEFYAVFRDDMDDTMFMI